MFPRPRGLVVALLPNWTEVLQFPREPDYCIGGDKRHDILSLLEGLVVAFVLPRPHRLIVVFQEKRNPFSTYFLGIHHGL